MTKLLRKTEQPSDYPVNKIHDAYNTSNSDTYCCNYINDINSKSYITVFSRGENHTGGKWSVIKFKITEEIKLGTTFTRIGDVIKVNNDLKGVLATATMNLTSDSYSYSGDLYIYQYRNGSIYKGIECRSIAGSGLKTMHAVPTLFDDVKKGDEFCFGHYTGSDSDTFSTLTEKSTYLTLMEV